MEKQMSEDVFPSLEEIAEIEDLFDAIDLLEKFRVPTDRLEDFDEFIERIKLEYHRRNGEPVKEAIGNAILESGLEDKRKRSKLIGLFEDLKRIVEDKDDSRKHELVEEFLNLEGTTSDIVKDCEARIADLRDGECVILVAGKTNLRLEKELRHLEGTTSDIVKDCESRIADSRDGECVILVAGESSSGKSSCINLLCGEDVLPVYAGHCTSTVVTIRYGAKRSARIKYTSPDKPDTVLTDLEGERMEEFRNTAFMRNAKREQGHDIQEIQLFLPVWFLKSGLVLADTPGIGESEFLEEYLMSYIQTNHILGFMYIIMSDQNGGIQEDRLLNLLRLIMEEQRKEGKLITFDPKTTLFVCNRFDAIDKESRKVVRDHILQKLGKYYPNFQEAQAVFFSAKKCQSDVDVHPDYISDQYKTLLLALQNLFSDSMDTRIKSSYQWIEKVLRRMVHLFKSTVRKLDQSERDRQGKSQNIMTKISVLKEKTNDVIKHLHVTIEAKIKVMVGELQTYLQKPQSKFTLCSAWNQGEIPNLEDMDDAENKVEWIRNKVDTAFFHRFCAFLEEWESEDGKISDIEAEVIQLVKQELGILESDIIDVESDMSDGTSMTGSMKNDPLNRRLSFAVQSGTTIDIGPRLALQLSGRMKKKSLLTKMKDKQKRKKISKDPVQWARERSEKLLSKLVKNKVGDDNQGVLDQFVRQLMQRPIDYIEKVGEKIPKMIQADEDLLKKIERLCVTERHHRTKYETMMESVENLRRCLMDYGEGYIFVNDFKSNEVKFLQQLPGGDSLAKTFQPSFSKMISGSSGEALFGNVLIPQGLWSTVYPGLLQQEEDQTNISLKLYLKSSGIENTFQEVAKLRCLSSTDTSLAEFLGIHHAEMPTPAFIYAGRLQSIKHYIHRTSDKKTFIHRSLKDTAEGLNYIHTKGLVHMELSVSTVTVNESGNVKLCGACIPRYAALPNQAEYPMSSFVYLAPEVLNKELYITRADVYGYGILIYELVCEREAFKHERKITFDEYLKRLDPEKMLNLNDDETNGLLTIRMRNLIRDCLKIDPQDRPKVSVIIETLEKHDKLRKSASVPTPVTPSDVFRRSTFR